MSREESGPGNINFSMFDQVFLTWNMARNIRVTDVNLFHAMKTTMMRSLRQSTLMKMYALERDVPVRFHGHGLNEPVNYCMVCEEEVSLVSLVPILPCIICVFCGTVFLVSRSRSKNTASATVTTN